MTWFYIFISEQCFCIGFKYSTVKDTQTLISHLGMISTLYNQLQIVCGFLFPMILIRLLLSPDFLNGFLHVTISLVTMVTNYTRQNGNHNNQNNRTLQDSCGDCVSITWHNHPLSEISGRIIIHWKCESSCCTCVVLPEVKIVYNRLVSQNQPMFAKINIC